MSEPTEGAVQPVLFVDTNGIHYARLYLGFASQVGLPPFGAITNDPKEELKKVFGGHTQTFTSHHQGLRIVNYLLDKRALRYPCGFFIDFCTHA